MKKLFYALAIGGALFLSVSSYSKTATTVSKKGQATGVQQENTCCGVCVEGRCH